MAEGKVEIVRRVGSRIRELRLERGWSLTYLAEHTGMSKTYLSNVETGQKEPCLVTLEVLAQGFGMWLAEFFGPV